MQRTDTIIGVCTLPCHSKHVKWYPERFFCYLENEFIASLLDDFFCKCFSVVLLKTQNIESN